MSPRLPRIVESSEDSFIYVQSATSLGGTSPGNYVTQVGGKERRALISSQGHPYPYRMTGPFFQSHQYHRAFVNTDHVDMYRGLGTYASRAVGGVCLPNGYVGTVPGSLPSIAAAASAAAPYQAIGWNRARPTRPVANLVRSLGELLKDGLPNQPGTQLAEALRRARVYAEAKAAGRTPRGDPRRGVARSLGSEYLNYDFGWRPMVDDAQKLLEAQTNIQRRIDAWRRSNGNTMRRRLSLLNDITTTSTRMGSDNVGAFIGGVGAFGTWRGNAQRIITEQRSVWFAAGFRVRLPSSNQEPRNMAVIRAGLLGAIPTPADAWALMPWSWMVDWFGNIGDVLENIFDPLQFSYAASYACIMQRTESKTMVQVSASQVDPSVTSAHVSVGAESGTITKYRSAASPYGFGVTFDGMTASQAATAAALGISRA